MAAVPRLNNPRSRPSPTRCITRTGPTGLGLPSAKVLHLRIENVGRVAKRARAARPRTDRLAAAPACAVGVGTWAGAGITRSALRDHQLANVAVAYYEGRARSPGRGVIGFGGGLCRLRSEPQTSGLNADA
jgi:hypothetical protein